MVGELMGLDNVRTLATFPDSFSCRFQSMPLMSYGPSWKQHRKLTHVALNAESVKRYQSIQEQHVAVFLHSLLESPQNFVDELRL
jgi:cytochrome P450